MNHDLAIRCKTSGDAHNHHGLYNKHFLREAYRPVTARAESVFGSGCSQPKLLEIYSTEGNSSTSQTERAEPQHAWSVLLEMRVCLKRFWLFSVCLMTAIMERTRLASTPMQWPEYLKPLNPKFPKP